MQFLNLIISIITACVIGTATAQEPCVNGLKQCSPPGASMREVPVIGPDLARFYLELVYTVRGAPGNSRAVQTGALRPRTDYGDSLCCAAESACDMIRSFKIAFCWDRFTTSYFLPDGSYGSASNGSYTTPQGDTANLITGEYHMQDGTVGNIYDESPADKPESSDLPLPTPFTNSGVGTAIPASELGAQLSQSATATASAASPPPSPETSSTSGTISTSSSPSSTTESTSEAAPVPQTTMPTSEAAPAPQTTMPTSEGATVPQTTMPTMSPTAETSSASTASSASEAASGPSSVSSTETSPGPGGSTTIVDNSTGLNSGSTGIPGASSTSVNGSWPIIPPITNLAAATVVYCMAAKVLVWLVAAVVL